MKRWLWLGVMATGIAVPALSSAAWAGGTDDYGCSNATLKGEYAFGVTVYTLASAVPTPPPTKVVNGIKVFDGRGNLTQRDYQGDNLAGPDFAPPGRETGIYQVNSNCTGSMVINLNVPNVPVRHLLRGHRHHVCDQRRRPSYPRGRLTAHSAGLLRSLCLPKRAPTTGRSHRTRIRQARGRAAGAPMSDVAGRSSCHQGRLSRHRGCRRTAPPPCAPRRVRPRWRKKRD